MVFDEDADQVTFYNRENWWGNSTPNDRSEDGLPRLLPDTFEKAKHAAPRYDVYWLEQEWREWWVVSGRPPLDNPQAAFVGFCKKRHEFNPNP